MQMIMQKMESQMTDELDLKLRNFLELCEKEDYTAIDSDEFEKLVKLCLHQRLILEEFYYQARAHSDDSLSSKWIETRSLHALQIPWDVL